ncbi:MAG: hypothetical protein WC189_04055 [Bacilli bacterium]
MVKLYNTVIPKRRILNIEDVREEYNKCNLYGKLEIKAWLFHSKSRIENNHPPFSYDKYCNTVQKQDILDQVKSGIIDCDDLGGEEEVIKYLLEIIK